MSAIALSSHAPWRRALDGLLIQYVSTWRSTVAMNFIYPVLYLTAMGVGLGSLVNRHLASSHAAAIGGVSYLTYIAPAILASSGMQIAIAEGTWPVMGRFKWERTYIAMLQTPLRIRDVVTAQLAYVTLRLTMTSAVFLLLMWAFGTVHSPEAIAEIPIGTLSGLAFATPCIAFTATQDKDTGFSVINRLVVIPLFLFSGSFFPITQLPGVLQAAAELTPLYHGVTLARAATTGHLGEISSLGHLAYLLALTAIGVLVAFRTFERRLAR